MLDLDLDLFSWNAKCVQTQPSLLTPVGVFQELFPNFQDLSHKQEYSGEKKKIYIYLFFFFF